MTTTHERLEPRTGTRTPGATLWLTGLPSAGKTTLATALAARLEDEGVRRVELLDGDEVREFLSKGLGFTREDRDTNVLRIGWVAAALARHGVPFALHVFPQGRHGLGLAVNEPGPGRHPAADWSRLCQNWLDGRGWLDGWPA